MLLGTVLLLVTVEGVLWLTHTDPSIPPSSTPEPTGARPTTEIIVRAILELPSPTATETPRPTATSSPDLHRSRDICTGTPEPGKICKVPPPPPPTPTPYPSCPDVIATPANAGEWCEWPKPTPTPGHPLGPVKGPNPWQ